MCDGSGVPYGGLYLCSDCFVVSDVVRLMNVLLIRFKIKSNLVFSNKLPRIYISSSEMKKLVPIVKPHMIPSMMYKLEGGLKKNFFTK